MHHWDRVGNLDREVAIYQKLNQHLKQVNVITYGGARDRLYREQLSPLRVTPTPGRLPVFASRLILQHRYGPILQQSDVFKTNQIPGAELAIWAKKKHAKKLIVRCGYLYSRFMEAYTTTRWRVRRAYALEREAFSIADLGIVTSERDRQWVIDTHHINPDKMTVVPNYVLTDLFQPLPETEKAYDLVCVSKAAPQKNLGALLTALHHLKQQGTEPSLLLIGSAAQDSELRKQGEALELDITYINRVANFELPVYLNQASAFILPSHYEGHPKALLEAMSCGLPCIGTDVPGIREDIDHNRTGYLCQPESSALAEAILTVLDSAPLQQTLGQQARQYILKHYSLESILDLELALLKSL